jgi:hypothetical protein
MECRVRRGLEMERGLNQPRGSIENMTSFLKRPGLSWARGEVIVLIDGEHHNVVLALTIY